MFFAWNPILRSELVKSFTRRRHLRKTNTGYCRSGIGICLGGFGDAFGKVVGQVIGTCLGTFLENVRDHVGKLLV